MPLHSKSSEKVVLFYRNAEFIGERRYNSDIVRALQKQLINDSAAET